MKLMSVEDVAALRQQDDVYKNQMQNLETGNCKQLVHDVDEAEES